MCVCVCIRRITSGVMDTIRLVKQVLQLYMATVVVIVNGHGLGIGTRHTY